MLEYSPQTVTPRALRQPDMAVHLKTIQELSVIDKLARFAVADTYKNPPEYTPTQKYAWDNRVKLYELLRPTAFNGSYGDIVLLGVKDPYSLVRDAIAAGKKVLTGNELMRVSQRPGTWRGALPPRTADKSLSAWHTVGFTITAHMFDSQRQVGEFDAHVFYLPKLPFHRSCRSDNQPLLRLFYSDHRAYTPQSPGNVVLGNGARPGHVNGGRRAV